MKHILIPAFFLLCSIALSAQDSLMLKFGELSKQLYSQPVNYLNGDAVLGEHESYFQNTSLESFYYQTSATFQANAGNQELAKRNYWHSKGKKIDSTIIINESLVDYRAIFKQTATHQIVMVNENHAFPEHRVFTTSLLKKLYEQGFRYLALEDIVNKDNLMNERKVAHRSDGLYINEIMYAEMVRLARTIGFTMVAYDNNDAWDIAERDSLGMVELNKIFEKEPKAKMLIHCGFGHIDEAEKVLASFIQSKLEINPLTISQVAEYPVASNTSQEPMLFMGEKESKLFGIQADFQVIHPAYDYTKRPEYLFYNARKKVRLQLDFEFTEQLLLEVYLRDNYKDAVPIDRVIIASGKEDFVDISVPKGDFIVQYKNKEGEVIKTMELTE